MSLQDFNIFITRSLLGFALSISCISVLPIAVHAAETPKPAVAAIPTAREYTLLAPLPCVVGGNVACDADGSIKKVDIRYYVGYMFRLAIALAGILAVIRIIAGGVQYMTTDAIQGKKAGKAAIQEALLGLFMTLASYLILRTIDPNLVTFTGEVPSIQSVKQELDMKAIIAAIDNHNTATANKLIKDQLEQQAKESEKLIEAIEEAQDRTEDLLETKLKELEKLQAKGVSTPEERAALQNVTNDVRDLKRSTISLEANKKSEDLYAMFIEKSPSYEYVGNTADTFTLKSDPRLLDADEGDNQTNQDSYQYTGSYRGIIDTYDAAIQKLKDGQDPEGAAILTGQRTAYSFLIDQKLDTDLLKKKYERFSMNADKSAVNNEFLTTYNPKVTAEIERLTKRISPDTVKKILGDDNSYLANKYVSETTTQIQQLQLLLATYNNTYNPNP